MLDLFAEAASRAALEGDMRRAGGYSRSWEESRVAIEETGTYNLDRKQHALNMITTPARHVPNVIRRHQAGMASAVPMRYLPRNFVSAF